MKKIICLIPLILALFFLILPATVNAQSQPDDQALKDAIKKFIEEETKKFKADLNDMIDSEVEKFRENLKKKVSELIERYKKNEKPVVGKPWLGFKASDSDDNKGIIVTLVYKNSPAHRAGLSDGDKINRFAGKPIKNLDDLREVIKTLKIGSDVLIFVKRETRNIALSMKIMTKEQVEKLPPFNPIPADKKIWLGFGAKDLKETIGIEITKVEKNGPAHRAGLKIGDIVKSFDGNEITSRDSLRNVLRTLKVGDKVGIGIRRGEQNIALSMKLMSKTECDKLPPYKEPQTSPAKPQIPWLGLALDTTYRGTGLKINVYDDGPAEKAGMKDGDIIISFKGEPTQTRADFAKIWKTVKVGDKVKIVFLRGDEKKDVEIVVEAYVAPEIPDKPKPGIQGIPKLPGSKNYQQLMKISNLNSQAILAMQAKEYDKAIKIFDEILKLDPHSDLAWYNLACIYSLTNNKDKGLECLEKAIIAGFIDWKHIEEDSDLDNIRDTDKYKKLMANKKILMQKVADKRIAVISEAYGETFNFVADVDSMLIFATEHPMDVLKAMKKKLLKYANAQWKTLFDNKQDYFITIIIPSAERFRNIVKNPYIGGFYSPLDRTLIAKELGYTLVHEFTHALHYADLTANNATSNIWFKEGLATCFENSVMKDGVPTPVHNMRLYSLQMYLKAKRNIKLSDMMKFGQMSFMQQADLCYAQARYFTYWLWETGKLKAVYDEYVKTSNEKNIMAKTGILAVENVFKMTIDEVEALWLKWVADLPPYTGFGGANKPFIGIRLEMVPGGIKITATEPGYPAEKAGLQADDIITHLDGERIIAISDLMNFIEIHKPGDAVVITVLRDGKAKEFKLKLAVRPKE